MQGNVLLAIDSLFTLPADKYGFANIRLAACRACEESTWLTIADYAAWVEKNGGKDKFMKEISSLLKWPALPKQEYTHGKKLFCRMCKCWLPAKSHVKNEQCPLNKW